MHTPRLKHLQPLLIPVSAFRLLSPLSPPIILPPSPPFRLPSSFQAGLPFYTTLVCLLDDNNYSASVDDTRDFLLRMVSGGGWGRGG